jgi:hypothetical protein
MWGGNAREKREKKKVAGRVDSEKRTVNIPNVK